MGSRSWTGYLGTPRRKRRGKTRKEQGRDEVMSPTPEMVKRKAEVHPGIEMVDPKTGKRKVVTNVHASLEALDLCHAHQIITHSQHRAGVVYRGLREFIFGSVFHGAVGAWTQVIHEHLDESWRDGQELTDDERHEQRLRYEAKFATANELLDEGPRRWLDCKGIVRRVCLDGLMPRLAEQEALRIGLKALARKWRITDDPSRHE